MRGDSKPQRSQPSGGQPPSAALPPRTKPQISKPRVSKPSSAKAPSQPKPRRPKLSSDPVPARLKPRAGKPSANPVPARLQQQEPTHSADTAVIRLKKSSTPDPSNRPPLSALPPKRPSTAPARPSRAPLPAAPSQEFFRPHRAPPRLPPPPIASPETWATLFKTALAKRASLTKLPNSACRVFSGAPDGVDGVFIDIYGPAAVMNLYEGRAPKWFDIASFAKATLKLLEPLGTKAVYAKPFPRDRSRMGGNLPPIVTNSQPAAGSPVPEAIEIAEHHYKLEVRLYDGMSTGLFLDQRNNRRWVAQWCERRATQMPGAGLKVLNTFAYTCAFSVAAATRGAITTNVDVSARYLDWGRRNLEINGLDPSKHHFAKFDTFEFFGYAQRKQLRFDLIILDPPSFSAGSKRKNIATYSSLQHFGALIKQAAALLEPHGAIFASTNTQELCRPGKLDREIVLGLGNTPRWLTLPPIPADFEADRERFAARAFVVR